MDEFCGSKFWDWNLTWNTDSPRFTPCFEKTVLIWFPCGLLYILSLIDIYRCYKSKFRDIPWGWLNISKLIGIGILLLITTLDISFVYIWHPSYMKMYGADYSYVLIKFITFLFVGATIVLYKENGIRTSGAMFIFWLLLVLCSLPHYMNEIETEFEGDTILLYSYVSNVIFYPVISFILVLEFFVDSGPTFSTHLPQKDSLPENQVSFVNNVSAIWYDSFAIRYYRKKLKVQDLPELPYNIKLEYLVPLISNYWNKKAHEVSESVTRKLKHLERAVKYPTNSFRILNASYENLKVRKHVSIVPVLWRGLSEYYIPIVISRLLYEIVKFTTPQVQRLLIKFGTNDEPTWHGYLYVSGLVVASLIGTIFMNFYVEGQFNIGLRMRSVLAAMIFNKVLKVSNSARRTFTTGEISNLMSVDAQRFYEVNEQIGTVLLGPIGTLASLYFLWPLLGVSALAGLVLLLAIVPLNRMAFKKIKEYQTRQMKYKDERIRITTEVLSGIKVLKMYAWEPSFEKKIADIREQEIKMLGKAAYLNAAIAFVWTTAPFLVSLVTFATFTLIDEKNILTTEIAFVSLTYFSLINIPISKLPRLLPNFVQSMVAVNRINKFLNSEELDSNAVSHDEIEMHSLTIENGMFAWDATDQIPTLRNISMHIEKGSLVAIVGPVGCGKSSLLSVFLGEMIRLEGRVNTLGSVAYSPQQAWLQNASLRDNILFTRPYEPNFYDQVVEGCALLPDLKVLPAGDLTEIGEKGVNLSGGQKQRINLARAVYNDAETYLLDDPLSAVDVHVGKHIFERVIGPKGLLKKKTRLLVTNVATYLPEMDYIVIMRNGSVVESGTYNDLMSKQGILAEYIANFSSQDRNPESEVLRSEKTEKEDDVLIAPKEMIPDLGPDSSLATILGDKLTEAEVTADGKIKWSVYSYYIQAGGVLFWSFSTGFFILYQVLFVLGNLWLTLWSSDSEMLIHNYTLNASKRYYYVGVYLMYGLGQVATVSLATFALYMATTRASSQLHKKLIGKVLKWPAYIFDVTPLGRIINRFSFDVDAADNTLPFILWQTINNFGTLLAILFMISYSSSIIIVFFVPLLIIYSLLNQIYVGIMCQMKRLESVSRTPVYSYFSETITGAPIIRAYGKQNDFILESHKRIYINQICTSAIIRGQRWFGLRLDSIGALILFLTSLFAVLGRDIVNPGIMSLAVTYALQILPSMYWTIRAASDIETNLVSIERIKEFENTPEEDLKSTRYKSIPNLWPNTGVIVFDKYKTRYREGLDFVLRGLDLRIESYEKIGIVGRTGAGKSSLALSLFRIIEAAEGKIVIDGIDISKVELSVLRSRVTVIPQDPVLFSGTVQFNLDPFYEYSDQDLWHVLELVHLKNYFKTLHQGLHYEISENGGNLSVGQRQLICLARALLRKNKILILDEATAAIDSETDELLQKTIRREFKQCTVLTVAHKLNTVMDSDRILVLDHGLVKEFDTPKNLLQLKTSLFYSMAKQAGFI